MSFDVNRRSFIKAMGSAGITSLAGCAEEPTKYLVSYLNPPENIVPGVTTWYASVCRECPAGCGAVVATREGRPVKIEGNPLHPINQGALCARGQAALQGLYNPDRLQHPLRKPAQAERFEKAGWEEMLQSLSGTLRDLKEEGSLDRVALVTPRLSGSLADLVQIWAEELPSLSVYDYEPISYEPIEKANEICFGRKAPPLYRMDEADLVVSFGADFLETWLSPVEYAVDFAAMRSYRQGEMGRLVYVGSRQCLTAANADTTVLLEPGTYGALVLGVVHIILEEHLKPIQSSVDVAALRRLTQRYDPETVYSMTGVSQDRVRHLARLFARARRSLAFPGGAELSGSNATQNAVTVNILNYVLGNFGETIEIPATHPSPTRTTAKDFSRLIDKMEQGELSLLILCDVNPVFTLPPSSGFVDALRSVDTVVSCSSATNETTQLSDYVLPVHTFLESWGDWVPREGVYGLMQPAVRPLEDSKHVGEVFIELSRLIRGDESKLSGYETYYDFLVDEWRQLAGMLQSEQPFPEFWEKALRNGGLFTGARTPPVQLSPETLALDFQQPRIEAAAGIPPGGLQAGASTTADATLIVYPSMIRYDGRGANRPWLQEVPDPMLQNAWGSCIEMSKETAHKMGLRAGDVLRMTSGYGSLECPVYVSELAQAGTVALAMGQGHWGYGRFADGTGTNPLALLPYSFDELSGARSYLSVQVRLNKTGGSESIPTPQGHSYDEGRGIVQTMSLASLRTLPRQQQEEPPLEEPHFKDLLTPHEHPEHRWGMTIDLNACIGCSACVVACYAENNVAVVGKEQYLKGREMAWIRVERYFNTAHPGEAQFLPMLCQQCENAPCEPVCPVFAAYHTSEGLNAQVYNRCIGTRYCANNCPYAARRFNWFTFRFPEPLHLQLNPSVTVREKGVMEKCTFCIQRIVAEKDRAKDENRPVRDGDITPACAQTCPTNAITFGDLKDPESEVSRRANSPRQYKVLEYLNTKPAITYLKKISSGGETD
jgi:molybdopterin-containing oxidoreductase family iron-sulfur binding subunit